MCVSYVPIHEGTIYHPKDLSICSVLKLAFSPLICHGYPGNNIEQGLLRVWLLPSEFLGLSPGSIITQTWLSYLTSLGHGAFSHKMILRTVPSMHRGARMIK